MTGRDNAGKMDKLRNRTGLSLKYNFFVQRIELQSVQGQRTRTDYLIVLKTDV